MTFLDVIPISDDESFNLIDETIVISSDDEKIEPEKLNIESISIKSKLQSDPGSVKNKTTTQPKLDIFDEKAEVVSVSNITVNENEEDEQAMINKKSCGNFSESAEVYFEKLSPETDGFDKNLLEVLFEHCKTVDKSREMKLITKNLKKRLLSYNTNPKNSKKLQNLLTSTLERVKKSPAIICKHLEKLFSIIASPSINSIHQKVSKAKPGDTEQIKLLVNKLRKGFAYLSNEEADFDGKKHARCDLVSKNLVKKN